MATFKVYFSSDNIRRLKTPTQNPTYADFISLLTKHYPTHYHDKLRIQYLDIEGDRIDVTTDIEWNEMFSQTQNQNPIKIYIQEPKNNSISNLGTNNNSQVLPVVAPAVIEPTSSSSSSSMYFSQPPPQIPQSGSNVTKCLEQFFPNGIILPFNIPPFLSGIVNVINLLGNTEVDLSVDVSGLAEAIYNKGIADFDHKLYKDASHTFRALGILQPEDFNAFYHVACAEALLGNYTESLLFLNKAIDLGYRDLDKIVQDASLNPISYTKGFELALNRLKDLILQETQAAPIPAGTLKKTENFAAAVVQEIEKIPEVTSVGIKGTLENEMEIGIKKEMMDFPYKAELEVLRDIGYMNDELVMPILKKNNGNVQQTVLELLDL